MSFLDALKKQVTSQLKREVTKLATDAVQNIGKGKNRSETFTFSALAGSLDEMKKLPEAALDSAFKTTALTILALCAYETDPAAALEMLNFLKGPEQVSTYEKQFFAERLRGKGYKARSFLEGATPKNSYQPTAPFRVKVSENPYSFDNENWATLYVTSSGADDPRPIKLRKKPSTGQWFLNDIQCLADIRVPVEEDPWA